MRCPDCGFSNPDGFAFCGRCGARLEAVPSPLSRQQLDTLLQLLPPSLSEQLAGDPTAWQPSQVIALNTHLASVLRTMTTYLPRDFVRARLSEDSDLSVSGQTIFGALLFADISGFTAMSERFSALGPEGAEEIVRVVNEYFAAMLAVLFRYGGVLLKFGGDALLGLFTGEKSALQAATAAEEMQDAMRRFAHVQTSLGAFALRTKIGLESGPMLAVRLGSNRGMEYTVVGPTVNAVAHAESLAQPGEIVLGAYAYHSMQSSVIAEERDESAFALKELKIRSQPVREQVTFLAVDAEANLDQTGEILDDIEALRLYLAPGLLSRITQASQEQTLAGERRPVTVLFANFCGVNALLEKLGPDHAVEATSYLNDYFVAMQDVIYAYDGAINKIDLAEHGNKLMALFGAPVAHEDDAERAIRAAVEMNQRLAELNASWQENLASLVAPVSGASPQGRGSERLYFPILQERRPTFLRGLLPDPLITQRIGVSTGFVFAGNVGSPWRREYTVMGDEVNLGARLMATAGQGEILISGYVRRKVQAFFLLQEKGQVHLKGKSRPVPIYQVKGTRAVPERVRGLKGISSPMVGRDTEVQALKDSLQQLMLGRGRIVSVTGDAGVGKSRLLAELRGAMAQPIQERRLRWIEGRCFSYSQTTSYFPLLGALKDYLHILPTDTEPEVWDKLQTGVRRLLPPARERQVLPYLARILSLPLEGTGLEWVLGLDGKTMRQQTFAAWREILRRMAQEQPVVLVMEDLHWADPTSLDFLEQVLSLTEVVPLMLCMLYRVERQRGCWRIREAAARDFPHRTIEVMLRPLSEAEGTLLVRNLHIEELAQQTMDLILQKAEGNPFYLEEVIRTLIDAGAIIRENGHLRIIRPLDDIPIPDTLQELVTARLDRLAAPTRRVSQEASVIGRIFSYGILEHISTADVELVLSLVELQRTELIRERRRIPEPEYIFKHVSTQEAAYRSLLVRQRQAYHRQVAHYVEETYHGVGLEEWYEALAHHYYHGAEWPKALEYLLKAGDKARKAYANEIAIDLYEQASHAALTLGDAMARADVTERLGQVQAVLGRYEQALDSYTQALHLLGGVAQSTDRAERPALSANQKFVIEGAARLHRRIAEVYRTQGDFGAAFERLNRGLSLLREADLAQSAEAARLCLQGAGVYNRQGQNELASRWCQQGLQIAQAVDEQGTMAHAYYLLAEVARRSGDLTRSVEYGQQSVRLYEGLEDISRMAEAHNNLANGYFDLGDWTQAGEHYQRAMEIKEKVGDARGRAMLANNLGGVLLNQGELDRAEDYYRQSLETWEQIGSVYGEAYLHNSLATVSLRRERWTEAIAHLHKSKDLFERIGADDLMPEIQAHLALAHLGVGEAGQARQAAQRSLKLAQAQEMRLEEGIAYRVLGQVALVEGQNEIAAESLEKSLTILKALNAEYEVGKSLYQIGRCYDEQGKAEQAAEWRERALAVFERLGAAWDLAQTRDEA